MVHDRDDKYDSQEDGEYHFSDDQANYDMEPETVKPSPVDNKSSIGTLGNRLNQYRKPIIGVVVFVLLVFLVYKISAPTVPTQPTADFAQNAGIIPTQKPTIKQLPKPIKVTEVTSVMPAPVEPLPQPNPLAMNNSTSTEYAAPTPTAIAPTASMSAAPVTTLVTTTTTTPPVVTQPTVTPTTAAGTLTPAENYYNPTQPNAAVVVVPDTANPADKLVALEEENAKLTAEYTQKLAETEAQSVAVQGKLQDLNMRLASIETTLSHLGRTIQETRTTTMHAPAMIAKSQESHIGYSVQAIIPGRAWLKSEAGETITVAEGDTLKNYGRIMKIDPYDGIVQIDTGGKVVSLSYGVSSE